MSSHTVEIRRVPEGESGVVQGRLTENVLESIASFYALPDEARRRNGAADPDGVAFLASRLGVTRGFVRKQHRNPKVLAAIRRRLNEVVTLMMPNVINAQYKLAVEMADIKSARFLAEIAGVLKPGGITVQQNVGVNMQVNNAKDGGIQEDSEILASVRNLRASGVLDRILNVKDITDVEPVEPDAGS